jgi:hypothetical protein
MNVNVKEQWSLQAPTFCEYEGEGTKYEGTMVPSSNPLFIIKIIIFQKTFFMRVSTLKLLKTSIVKKNSILKSYIIYQYKKLIIIYRYILHFIIFYNLKI